jgi:hypothetical protein
MFNICFAAFMGFFPDIAVDVFILHLTGVIKSHQLGMMIFLLLVKSGKKSGVPLIQPF